MRTIVILQNSQLSFGLDAANIFQPKKYQLVLIVNDFCEKIVIKNNQMQFYKEIVVTNDFSFENISLIIKNIVASGMLLNVVTNAEETMPVCGEIRKFLDLDNNDYSRFYNKHIMKSKLKNAKNIFIPKYKIFNAQEYVSKKEDYLKEFILGLRFPLFAKPIQLLSSMNLKKIENYTSLKNWADDCDFDHVYEIDEFIEGVMYHCDSYIKNSQILFTFVSRNSRPCYDFTIGQMKGTIVLPEEHADAVFLSKTTEQILKIMGMPRGGVTHLELMLTKDRKVYFIEIAHRSPGCLIPKMYAAHAGIDTISSHFLLQIDSEYTPLPERKKFSAWSCYPKKPGIIKDFIKIPAHITSHCETEWHVKIDDKIETFSQFGRDYTGTLFMVNEDFDQIFKEFLYLNDHDLCDIRPIEVAN